MQIKNTEFGTKRTILMQKKGRIFISMHAFLLTYIYLREPGGFLRGSVTRSLDLVLPSVHGIQFLKVDSSILGVQYIVAVIIFVISYKNATKYAEQFVQRGVINSGR